MHVLPYILYFCERCCLVDRDVVSFWHSARCSPLYAGHHSVPAAILIFGTKPPDYVTLDAHAAYGQVVGGLHPLTKGLTGQRLDNHGDLTPSLTITHFLTVQMFYSVAIFISIHLLRH